jgi:hypothetical protein
LHKLDAFLERPKMVTRKTQPTGRREELTVMLKEEHRFLPVDSYPCKGGLQNLMYYKPSLALLSRHEEWVPREQPRHAVLHQGIVRRATCVGALHERNRTLERTCQQVLAENGMLFGEIARLRELLEGAAQQEEIMKTTLEREREMRKASERERAAESRAREEAEEGCGTARQQVAQLQSLLQQAVEYHDSAAASGRHLAARPEHYYGLQQGVGV